MPWKECKPMDERLKFIARRLDDEKMAPVCRAYERLNLTATALGVAMHPMSQVLQEYSDNFDLQKRFLDYLDIPEGHLRFKCSFVLASRTLLNTVQGAQ